MDTQPHFHKLPVLMLRRKLTGDSSNNLFQQYLKTQKNTRHLNLHSTPEQSCTSKMMREKTFERLTV